MRRPKQRLAGFTLVEMVVAGGAVAIVGLALVTLVSAGVRLYAQNLSINQTQSGGLSATEKIMLKVAAATEAPTLVDDAGAMLSGTGPAAGVRYLLPASVQPYSVPTAVGATATSFTMAKSAGQIAPLAGDTITMFDLGFRGVITSVAPAGSNYSVGFASSVGSGFSPAKTAGTVIPAGSKLFLLRPAAFISVAGVLRHYPRALSVAQNGAGAFNTAANFDAVATLLPVSTQTNCFPFQYLDATRRSIDVSLRVRAPAYGSKIGGFYAFQNLRTTMAFRSAASW